MSFDAQMYERLREGCRSSAEVLVPAVMDFVGASVWPKPGSVVDVGCGEGWFAAAFMALDVPVPALGVDLARPDTSPLPPSAFVELDLSRPSMIPKADLALCLEVAEHLPEQRGPGLVGELTAAAPTVVFSAAIPGQGGHGHINERWSSYWAQLFALHGFAFDTTLRELIWRDERIEPWYRQSLVVFSRFPGIANSTTNPGRLDVVHPEIYGWKLAELQQAGSG